MANTAGKSTIPPEILQDLSQLEGSVAGVVGYIQQVIPMIKTAMTQAEVDSVHARLSGAAAALQAAVADGGPVDNTTTTTTT